MSLISVLLADNQDWGWRKFLFFGSIFPIYFIGQHLIRNYGNKIKVLWLMVSTAIIVAGFGLAQFISQFFFSFEQIYRFWGLNIVPVISGFSLGAMIMQYPSWYVNLGSYDLMRAFSIYSDPHMLAFGLGLILPLGLALYLITRKKWLLIANGLFLVVLALTFTRGAYMAMMVSLLAMAGLLWWKLKLKKTAIWLISIWLIFIIPQTPVGYRFYTIFNFQEESNVGRLEMWQQASDIGRQNLLTGIGLGNYSIKVRPELGYRNPTTAHNLYLDIFSETGLIALIFWLLLIIGSLLVVYRKINHYQRNQKISLLYVGLFGSLIYYAVHSIFETSIYQPVIIVLFLIIVGLVYSQNEQAT